MHYYLTWRMWQLKAEKINRVHRTQWIYERCQTSHRHAHIQKIF